MKRFVRIASHWIVAIAITLAAASTLSAQRRDTVIVTQSTNGGYQTCYSLLVTNGQADSNVKISEFRLTIISGAARFTPGTSQSPFNWTVIQTQSTVSWTSNAAASDIGKGETKGGFNICAQDTGVFKVVWETRNLDSLISRDTLLLAGRKYLCDEAFFHVQPSSSACVADIDLVGGNGTGRLVNDFRLHMISPGVSFNTANASMPPGWVLLRAKPDTLVFFTQNRGIDVNQIAQGFRVEFLGAQHDSLIEVEWWTANFGEPLCLDTARFTCGLDVGDTVGGVRLTTGEDSCCQNIRLKNTHQPTSTVDAFTLKVTTPGARFMARPNAPTGWNVTTLTPAADTLAFTATSGGAIPFGDTTLFQGICFNNAGATTDTIRYQWKTYSTGIPVVTGTGFFVCIRPLTIFDTVTAIVDSTFPATRRCISLSLKNRNSRHTPITRFVVHISNPGTKRVVGSATAPSPWRVESFGGDSVIFTGGQIVAGGGAGPFTLCASLGDSATRDPVTITWRTANGLGTITTDSLKVNAIITNDCDSVDAAEVSPVDLSNACFTIRFLNRNGKNKPLENFRLDLASQQVIFTSASAPSPWSISNPSFPTFDLEFGGGTVAAGDMSPAFTACIDISQLPSLPAVIPIVWRTFSQGGVVCVDTVHVTITGVGPNACDTVPLVSYHDSAVGGCNLGFRVINRHSPATPIDGVRFLIAEGTGVFVAAQATGGASAWTSVTRSRDSVLFRGSSLAAGAATDTFFVQIDSSNGASLTIQGCTLNGDQVVCCSQRTVTCNTSGVDLSFEPTGFKLYENTPNPFGGSTQIRYDLMRASHVMIIVRDGAGRELRRVDRGREESGAHALDIDLHDLPSGIYYYTLQTGDELETRRMVLVK